MPLFIFIPNEAAIIVSGDLFATPIAPFDSEGHIPRNTNIVFGISATGTVVFDYFSLNIKINNVNVVTAGIPSAGYSLSLDQGNFYNVVGLIFTLNPPSNLSAFTTYTIDIDFTTINLQEYSMHYTFRTSDKSTVLSNFPFGNTNLNRYYFNSTLRKNVQNHGYHKDATSAVTAFDILSNPINGTKLIAQVDSVAGIPEVLNQYFGNFDHIENTYVGDDLSALVGSSSNLDETENIFKGLGVDIERNGAILYSQIDARNAQAQGQATPFPTILGPRFGAKVLDRQVESLKIQQRAEDE